MVISLAHEPQTLKKLSEAPGIPGREERVREILKTEV
jgi:putative aminopeptidase FrvX